MRFPIILVRLASGVISRTRSGLHIRTHFNRNHPTWIGIYQVVLDLEAMTPSEVVARGLDPVSHGELITEGRDYARQEHAIWRVSQGF